jgi:hypothetical protein
VGVGFELGEAFGCCARQVGTHGSCVLLCAVCCRVDTSACCTAQDHHSGCAPPHQQCPRQQPGEEGGGCLEQRLQLQGLRHSAQDVCSCHSLHEEGFVVSVGWGSSRHILGVRCPLAQLQ